jgi:hypothetical protein
MKLRNTSLRIQLSNSPVRHCEERKRRSNPSRNKKEKSKLDCFVASLLAMTAEYGSRAGARNDVNPTHAFATPRRIAPGPLKEFFAL